MDNQDLRDLAESQSRARDIVETFTKCDSDWSEIRRNGTEDLLFYNGEQYDEQKARAARASGNKVQIRLNMLGQYVQQVDNARRQKDIAITCHPTDEKGSEEGAQVREGIFRHVEDISSAKHAYNTAFGPSGSLVNGLGFLKIETNFVDDKTFNQDIFIRSPKDSTKILADYNAKCPVWSDAEYWFEFDDMTKDDFKKEYPDAHLSSFPTWNGVSKKTEGWVTHDTVRVAKYWYKEKETITLVQYEDGTVQEIDLPPPNIPLDDNELSDKAFNNELDGTEESASFRPANVDKTRTVDKVKVKWIITNGYEILEEGEWHNADFPFVPCIGNELIIGGKRYIHGITRFARDPQMIVNYLSSELVRKTAATTKSQWMVDVDSVPPQFRKDWMSSNVSEKAVLFYTSKTSGRDNIPPPSRLDLNEPQTSNLLQAIGKSMNDIKQTVGVSPQSADALTGVQQNNQSGIAIQTLAEQGELANFHFSDNMVLAMKRLGQLIINLIPYIYDTPRVIRIINPDSTPELMQINQMFQKGNKTEYHDLTTGDYSVVVDAGPGFATKKAMMSEQMIKFASLDPQLLGILANDIVRNSDWDVDGTMEDKIIQWQAFTYPWLKQSLSDKEIPPEIKAQVAQLQQQAATANQHLMVVTQAYQAEKAKNDSNALDNAAKVKIEMIKQKTAIDLKRADLQLELIKSNDAMHQERLKMQLEHLNETRGFVMEHLQHIDKLNAKS